MVRQGLSHHYRTEVLSKQTFMCGRYIMIYYRLALQERQTSLWTWKSTGLTSLNAVFQLLRSIARSIPPDRIRVFTSSAKEDLHEMLSRENNGLASGSVTAAQFLQERGIRSHAMEASEHDVHGVRENQGTGSSVVSTTSSLNGDDLSLAEGGMRMPTLQAWATTTPPDALPNESRTATCSLNGGSMYDYVIVGAGSAGCVLAHRLTEEPTCSVLLLESGGADTRKEFRIPAAFSTLLQSAYDWSYYTEEQEQLQQRNLYIPRGKVLGGSSSINTMIYTRGNRYDYDH